MRLFILLFLTFFFLSCILKERKKDIFQIIDLKASGDYFDPERKIFHTFKKSTRIVYKGEYTLYLAPETKHYTEAVRNEKGEVIDERASKVDTIYKIYVMKLGDKECLKYSLNNFNSEKGILLDADSARQDLTLSDKDLHYFDKGLGTPTEMTKNGKVLTEKFLLKKNAIGQPDSVYRYYNQDYNDIVFSFSKYQDRQKKSKLYRSSYIYCLIDKGIVLPDVAIPRREVFYEIVKVSDKRTGIFNEIIEKFKKDRLIK